VQASVLYESGLHVLVRNGLENEAERHELQQIRLNAIVLRSSSESITMPFRQKPENKTDISLDILQATIVICATEICGRDWVQELSPSFSILSGPSGGRHKNTAFNIWSSKKNFTATITVFWTLFIRDNFKKQDVLEAGCAYVSRERST